MEDESILGSNHVTTDAFSHASNTQIDNANPIFTSKKLDNLDDLADALKYLTINDAKYYESDKETAIDAQGDPTRDPKIVTHTSNRNENFMDTSNGNFEQKLLSNQTIPVIILTINPRISQRIYPMVLVPQTLLDKSSG